MSGTGKSSMILDLQSRGYHAVDLDTDVFSVWADIEPNPEYPDNEVKPGKDWIWNEVRVMELLTSKNSDLLFVSGCASNMPKFYSQLDHVVLLTAPDEVIVKRLKARNANAHGHLPGELERVLRLKQTIEPLLRKKAELEIDTNMHRQSCVDVLLNHLGV